MVLGVKSCPMRAKFVFVSTCSLLFPCRSCSALESRPLLCLWLLAGAPEGGEAPSPHSCCRADHLPSYRCKLCSFPLPFALLGFMAKNCLMAAPTKFPTGKSKTLALLTAKNGIFTADDTSFLISLPSFCCCLQLI